MTDRLLKTTSARPWKLVDGMLVSGDDWPISVAADGDLDGQLLVGAVNEYESLRAIADAARAVRNAQPKGLSGYSPHECLFCEAYLLDDPVVHAADCEFRVLDEALCAHDQATLRLVS